MKILILRFSSIGDIVLTTPVIRCLRKKYPQAQIHYATKQAFAGILQANPYLHKVHVLGNSLTELVKELRQEQFDYVIDLHNNQRTFVIKLLLGVRAWSFNKLNFKKWLLVNFKINLLPPVHIVDRYLATCRKLDVINDGEGLDYFVSAAEQAAVVPLPPQFGNGYIGWVIGAKQHTKQFPVHKITAALQHPAFAALPVVLLGGKEDAAAAEEIIAKAPGRALYNACGRYSLNGSAWLVKQARLVIANDTGLMHIAAAYKKPVISLWGNTVPAFGMYPYFGKHAVSQNRLQVENLKCRPCSKLGYSHCPLQHFKCMNDIDNAALVQTVEDILKGA